MKRIAIQTDLERGVEVNLSPLIDCVFLLLIFFIVSTVFVEPTGVAVQTPRATRVDTLEAESILITLTEEGRVFFGGREIGLHGVRGAVARQLQVKAAPVTLLADGHARTAPLVDLIDECRRAGAEQVSIAARREE